MYTQLHSEKERRVESRSRVARKRFGKAIRHSRDGRIDLEAFKFTFVPIWACTSSNARNWIPHSYFILASLTSPLHVTALNVSIASLSLTPKITHESDLAAIFTTKNLANYRTDGRYNLVQSIVWILPWWKATFVMPSIFFFFLNDFFTCGVLQKFRG